MEEENLGKLLNELAERTAEPVGPDLAEEIKQHIPHSLMPHRKGIDTINIVIDLRVSKLATAAAIIITMILLASFLGSRDSAGSGVSIRDSKVLAKYLLGGADTSNISTARAKYEFLLQQGKDAVFYGDIIGPQDNNAVLMQWKLADGRYMVVFGDLREREVGAEELIQLQAQMLLNKIE